MASELTNQETSTTLIQSLDRGLELLEIISKSQEPLGLPELAQSLEVDRSTVFRLLGTLLLRGYVIQDQQTKRYSIGYKVVEISRRAIDRNSLRMISKPYLKDLVNETNESVNLVVLTGREIVCIDQESCPSPLAVTNDIGATFLPHATALGKAVLAFAPDEIRKSIIDTIVFESYTPRTIVNMQVLENSILSIRQQFFALDDEERYIGVRCLAAPIFDYRNKVIGAVGISGPTIRFSLEKVDSLARIIRSAALKISIQMGFSSELNYPT
ncbi:MAG: IclR family transcriptional regulator [Anaerolineaceae bacterium]|jgi:IclR family KDG regulon transcriptional repressor